MFSVQAGRDDARMAARWVCELLLFCGVAGTSIDAHSSDQHPWHAEPWWARRQAQHGEGAARVTLCAAFDLSRRHDKLSFTHHASAKWR